MLAQAERASLPPDGFGLCQIKFELEQRRVVFGGLTLTRLSQNRCVDLADAASSP
jgi:hypothetical protein